MYRRVTNRRDFIGGSAVAATALLSDRAWARQVGSTDQARPDPTDLSITDAAPLIRGGDLSPVELVRGYLGRIARLDQRLNAYITVTEEEALTRAQELEAELVDGTWRGPLHGIPIALKDNIDTAGIRTTAASALFEERIPERDAEVVTRLEAAGAIVLGKLNLHEFAYGATSAITHFGPVGNPWDTERIPGGSSGGSGAAVAARLCAAALGTDTGGSIRIPAAYCGIVGLKPTYGLSSIRGIIPLSVSYDHVGPMCRTVSDTALMLQAMAGYDPLDVASRQSEVPTYSAAFERRTDRLRLGVPRSPFYEDIDPQIAEALGQALRILGQLTAGIEDVEIPSPPDVPLVLVEAYEYHADYLAADPELYAPLTRDRILRGADVSAVDYARGKYEHTLARRTIARSFDDIDLLITPTMALLPITIDEARSTTSDAERIRNTSPFNAYGLPTVTVPCGFSREAWPIGLQITGKPFGELDVLAVAHAYEQATEWHERVPPVAS